MGIFVSVSVSPKYAIERRRCVSNASGRYFETSYIEVGSSNESTDMHLSNALSQLLDSRDGRKQCINNCSSKLRVLSICPGNIAALRAQADI